MESVKIMKRSDYSYFQSITTRWADNDSYGHVNNVVYYSYFDTIANQYLIEFSDFKPLSAPIIGLVAHSNCTYIKAIAYPDKIEAGLSVKKLGNSSVTYSIGIFKKGENTPCLRQGTDVTIRNGFALEALGQRHYLPHLEYFRDEVAGRRLEPLGLL